MSGRLNSNKPIKLTLKTSAAYGERYVELENE